MCLSIKLMHSLEEFSLITGLILPNEGMYPKCYMHFQHQGLGCFCVALLS